MSTFLPNSDTPEIVAALIRDGDAILERLTSMETIEATRVEVDVFISEKEQESSGFLWQEGNKTVGGLAACSPTSVEKLLTEPKVLKLVDGVLEPFRPMINQASQKEHRKWRKQCKSR